MIFIYILRGFSTVCNMFTCNLRTIYQQSTNTGRRLSQLERGSGMFASRIGNLLQAFSWVLGVTTIMEMDSCFAEVTVLVDETVQVRDVASLAASRRLTQGSCVSSESVFLWENSLQHPFFGHASKSRLELGDCLQAGCPQGVSEEFEHGGEEDSLKHSIKRRR